VKYNGEQNAGNTDPETFRKVARNTPKRVDTCIAEGGGHFKNLLQNCSVHYS
jgi:hypothetical protein